MGCPQRRDGFFRAACRKSRYTIPPTLYSPLPYIQAAAQRDSARFGVRLQLAAGCRAWRYPMSRVPTPCIPLPPYGSDSHNPSYKRARRVARAGREALRHATWTHHSRAARKCSRERRRASVHAAGGNRAGRPRSVGAQGLHALVKRIADTGFLVAFANGNDRHHGWAVQLAGEITEPALT